MTKVDSVLIKNTYVQSSKTNKPVATNPYASTPIIKKKNITPQTPKELKIKHLKEEFQLAKNEQGFIGSAWNGLKNIFNTEFSSNNIEKLVNQLSTKSSEQEIEKVEKMIAQYRNKQDNAVDTFGTATATIVAGAAGAKVGGMLGAVVGSVIPGAGTVIGGAVGTFVGGLIGGTLVGAATKVSISQIENMTDDVDNNAWHNDKNLGKEALSGGVAGLTSMLFGGITQKVSGAVKSSMGVTQKGVILAENGSANIAKTVKANAIAEAVGGATASRKTHFRSQRLR